MNRKELLDKLYLQARKNGNKVAISCLSTMKGEIENQIKNKLGNFDFLNCTKDELEVYLEQLIVINNDLIEKYAIKSKKSLIEFKPKNYEEELVILEQFLPLQLSKEEILNKIKLIIMQNNDINENKLMGLCMRELKGVEPNLVKQLIAENK